MKGFRVCVNNQTPLVRFKLGYSELIEKYGFMSEPIDLKTFVEGEDYEYTPGGVTAMVRPLLKRMLKEGVISEAHWVSLGPNAPSEVMADEVRLHNISINDRDIPFYSNFKEGIWREMHGLGPMKVDYREYEAYARYNWTTAQLLLQLLPEVDLFFVHDFQQLQIGNLIGPSAPTILRWHIPFQLDRVSKHMRTFILKNIEDYDAIIVSTRRDLEGLIHAGYRGKAHQIYPYLDPDRWDQPLAKNLDSFREKIGLKGDEELLLIVGRMDGIKGQDLAIRALALLKDRFPNLKLLLAGDGSFSGSSAGGLSHPKAALWRVSLQDLARTLKVDDSVIFVGHLKDDEVKAAYCLASMVLVTSSAEGFNLTTVEGWLCKKPVVVSRGSGSSELVNEGVNGYTFVEGEVDDLTAKVEALLIQKEASSKMGENGFYTAKQCYIEKAIEKLASIFDEVVKLY